MLLAFSLPLMAYGVYILMSPPNSSERRVQDMEEEEGAKKVENMLSQDVESIYWMVWREYVRTMGANGPMMLERRIHAYMNQGMSKDEAIRRLARNEKIH
jgi:hypothetical protein